MDTIRPFIYQKINKKKEEQMPLQIELFPPTLEEIEQYHKQKEEEEENYIIIIDLM